MSFLDTDQELTRHSYYAATAIRDQHFPALQEATRADVAIVGGGLAGLNAAIELRRRGFDVVLLEARELGSGASGRNGGQAIHGLACDPPVIEQQLGLADAKRVWDMTIEALDLIRERCREFQIDCDWRDGFLNVAVNARKAAQLQHSAERTTRMYGYPLTWIDKPDLPRWIDSPRYAAAVHDARSGHLHPLKYTLGLARAAAALGVRVHENSIATALQALPAGALLRTVQGSVQCAQVLLAGNVYLPVFGAALAPRVGRRIMPVGTYIVCSEPLAPALADALIPCGAAVCDTNFILDYFRMVAAQRAGQAEAEPRLLYGGRVSYSTATPIDMAAGLRRRMLGTFPQLAAAKTEYAWGGFVDISMSRAPDFGRVAPNVYYLQGFSGHGLSLAGLAGKLVAEAMAGDASRFDVFARLKHRPFPGGRAMRMPALVLGMSWYRLRDMLG
jgi:gamma-glutamylputrescine oxidase